MSKLSRLIALVAFLINFDVLSQNIVKDYNTLKDDYGVSGFEFNNSFFMFAFFNSADLLSPQMHLKLMKFTQYGQPVAVKDYSMSDSSIKILNYRVGNNFIELFCSVSAIDNHKYNSLIVLKVDTGLNLISKQNIGVFAHGIYSLEVESFHENKTYFFLSLDTTANGQGAVYPYILQTDSLFEGIQARSHFSELMDFRIDKAWVTTNNVVMLGINYGQTQRFFAKLNSDLIIDLVDSMVQDADFITSPLLGRFNILKQNNGELTVLGYSDSLMPSLQYRSAKRMSIVKFDSNFQVTLKVGFKSKFLPNTEDNHQYFTPWYGIGRYPKSSNYYIGSDVIYTPFSANSPMVVCLDSSLGVKWESYIYHQDTIVRLQYIYGSQYGGCWVIYVKNAINGSRHYDMALVRYNDKGWPTSILNIEHWKKNITIHPNPFNGYLKIDMNHSTKGIFELMNVEGKMMLKQEISQDEINTINLPTGIYYYRISGDDNEVLQIGKLIKN
jgi:hypothetical protein